MKKILTLLSAVFVLAAATPAINAFAADGSDTAPDKKPTNVAITVVLPETDAAAEPEPPAEPTPEPIKLYPVDVTETLDGSFRQIVKTYELSADETPADIPRADFERKGWKYTLTDILRKESANVETREHTEPLTLNTDTKEIEKIMPLLAPTMEFKADDGFVGVLTLDVASIKVETAGTKTSSYTMSVTREYPHLSANDTELVPKTINDKGKTYTLAGVEWQAGNYSTVDYERIADYYTAIATYTATGSSTKVTGYITTAEYKGMLSKLIQGKTVYTAYFLGEEIRTPLEMTPPPTSAPAEKSAAEPTTVPTESVETTTPNPAEITSDAPDSSGEADQPAETPDSDGKTNGANALFIAIPVIGAMAGGAYYFYKKRKGKINNA